MPTWVATVAVNDGQAATSTDATVSLAATGAQAGDVLLVYVDSALSTNTISTGPPTIRSDANGSNQKTFVLGKLLTAADITAGSVTVTMGSTARVVAFGDIWRGAILPTSAQVALNAEPTATDPVILPTATVTVGSGLSVAFLRRRIGSGAALTAPSPYTAGASAVTNFGSSVVNVFGTVAHESSAPSSSVGGESGSYGFTCLGNNYLTEVPSGQVDTTVQASAAFAGAGAVIATPVTLVVAPSAFTAARSGSAVPGAVVSVPSASASAGAAGSALRVAVDTTAVATSAAISASGQGTPSTTVFYRFQWWDGSQWRVVVPKVWDGSQWLVISVTLTPAI